MKKTTFIIFSLLTMLSGYAQNNSATTTTITAAGTFVISTVDGDPSTLFCAANGAITNGNPHGEWYKYIPSQDYTVTVTSNISANNPLIDTRFHVYTRDCSNLVCFAGDNDSGANYSSSDTFNVVVGTTYFIVWDNRWFSSGFTFQLIEDTYTPPPPAPISYSDQNISTINSSYNPLCIIKKVAQIIKND
ncbi:MAG: hypothetical protein IE891_04990 [Flavobacteriaceae bacterium]|nr:hypothetical protein [Flavobacteriaceae bacterium]